MVQSSLRLFWLILEFRREAENKQTPQNPTQVLPAVFQDPAGFCLRFNLLLKFKHLGKVIFRIPLKLQLIMEDH